MRCVIVALAITGCSFQHQTDPAEPDCAAACDRMELLGCDEAEPTPGGASCVQVCRNVENSPVTLNPACVVGIQTCEQIESCVDGLD